MKENQRNKMIVDNAQRMFDIYYLHAIESRDQYRSEEDEIKRDIFFDRYQIEKTVCLVLKGILTDNSTIALNELKHELKMLSED